MYVRLLGDIHHALNDALAEERGQRKLTRADIARLLGVDRSFVTRKFAGTSNMTLETLADFAFALDRRIKVTLPARGPMVATNQGAPPLTPPIAPQSAGQVQSPPITKSFVAATY